MELWAQAPRDHVVSRLESTVDTGIKPGDDFFGYANGAWLKATVLPAGKNRWAVRDDINERTRRQVEAILDDAYGAPGPRPQGGRLPLRLSEPIRHRGQRGHLLKPLVSRIDSIGDKQALTRLLGSTMHADVDPLNFGIYTSSSILGYRWSTASTVRRHMARSWSRVGSASATVTST
jgi:predicted metalloendopeptidase